MFSMGAYWKESPKFDGQNDSYDFNLLEKSTQCFIKSSPYSSDLW